MNRRWMVTDGCYFKPVISRFFGPSAVVRQLLAVCAGLLLAACVSGAGALDTEGAGGAPASAGSAGSGGQGSTSAGAAGTSNPGAGAPAAAGAPSMGGSTSVELCNYPEWVPKKPYVAGDKVLYLGKGYVATGDNPGYDPTVSTFFWSSIACQSVIGAGGAPGSAGATGGGAGAPNTTACPALDRLLTNGSASFDAMFQPPWAGHVAKSLYTYAGLCAAIASKDGFKPFANSGDLQKDKRELAAFFAHVAKETAFLEQTDEAQQASDAADYHGRGAIQLTGYANYAAAGQYLGKDLTGNPGMVSKDPQTNWQSALWFWMINYNPGTAGVQNCHQAIQAGDFGQTTRIINGGIECPGSQSAKDRAQYFKNDCMVISVDPGSALVC